MADALQSMMAGGGTTLCVVNNLLTGVPVCEVELPDDASALDLKKQLSTAVQIPSELLMLLVDNVPLADDHLLRSSRSSCLLEVDLVQQRLEAACTEDTKLCDALRSLKDFGVDALQTYLEEIVALLQRPSPWRPSWYVYERRQDVHVHACRAVKELGVVAAPYAQEVVLALANFMGACKERATVVSLLDADGRFWSGSSFLVSVNGRDGPSEYAAVLAAMGHDALLALCDNLADLLSHCEEMEQRIIVLLALAKAIAGTSLWDTAHAGYVQCFVPFLKDAQPFLRWCGACCLSHILQTRAGMASFILPYVEDVSRLFLPANAIVEALGTYAYQRSHVKIAMSMTACKLLVQLGAEWLPSHFSSVFHAMLSSCDDYVAQNELTRFQRCIEKKSHGSFVYSWLKGQSSVNVLGFSDVFLFLGYDGFLAMRNEFASDDSRATTCQRALMLLIASRAFPTFSKVAALESAAWMATLLKSSSWELRMSAVHGLQRLLAGNMLPQVHDIVASLGDEMSFVRQLAATALGCCGRTAARYHTKLLPLLRDPSCHVRYSALVTLGGCLAKALPFERVIVKHLTDSSAKCRMAALRALKGMGKTAHPYKSQLLAWQKMWYAQGFDEPNGSRKREPITTKALLFPDVPLKNLFRGHAPLGNKLAGAPRTCERRQTIITRKLATRAEPKEMATHVEALPEFENGDADPILQKELRESYWCSQQRFRAQDALRRQAKHAESAHMRRAFLAARKAVGMKLSGVVCEQHRSAKLSCDSNSRNHAASALRRRLWQRRTTMQSRHFITSSSSMRRRRRVAVADENWCFVGGLP
eukprot:TRINITY_DN27575_c0_g1_i1.p1 TRINITY_DN27575_c0_g1~~TRINITY_DN27575_c0_g1_i1.p1  ORF type:complete len:817 (-),score=111.91 TRINITY_DN27575_c0_g1_i1:167-2617(-)